MSGTTTWSGARLLALLAAVSIALAAGALVRPALVLADGDDSPAECTALAGNVDGGDGDEVVVTAPAGQIINAICIKSGEAAFDGLKHSGLIDADGPAGDCYTVAGIGTDEVTVTRVDDSDCHGISHVDFGTAAAPTPTPTPAVPTPTPTEGGGELGGNPTPTPAPAPNTAMTPPGGFSAVLLSLLLIGSLATMAYVRVTSRR